MITSSLGFCSGVADVAAEDSKLLLLLFCRFRPSPYAPLLLIRDSSFFLRRLSTWLISRQPLMEEYKDPVGLFKPERCSLCDFKPEWEEFPLWFSEFCYFPFAFSLSIIPYLFYPTTDEFPSFFTSSFKVKALLPSFSLTSVLLF